MNRVTITTDQITVTIEAQNEDELLRGLESEGLEEYFRNKYYFSRMTEEKTGDGWLLVKDMPTPYLINAFIARFNDLLKDIKDVDYAVDLFTSLMYQVELYATLDQKSILLTLWGLLKEITRRA